MAGEEGRFATLGGQLVEEANDDFGVISSLRITAWGRLAIKVRLINIADIKFVEVQ
jgi:hypothetical protein